MAISATDVHRLYLAYFGRPADRDGFLFYTVESSWTVQSVAAAFSASEESEALYGSAFGSEQINRIYLALFGREAEPAGLSYWLEEVASGRLSPAFAAYGILVGAQGDDADAVANKLQIAQEFHGALDTTAEWIGYAGEGAAASARAFVATVTHAADSLATAQAGLEAAVAEAIAAEPPTNEPEPEPDPDADPNGRVLTAQLDNFAGSAGADVFTGTFGAAGATVTAGDKIHGGAGEDTLRITLAGGGTMPAVNVVAVETIEFLHETDDEVIVDAQHFAGARKFVVTGTSDGVLSLRGVVTTGAVTVDAGAFAGAVEFAGATGGAGGEFNFTGTASNDIFNTFAALTAGTVDGGAGDDVLSVRASAHLTGETAARYTGFETIRVHDGVTLDAALLQAGQVLQIEDGSGAAATRVTGLAHNAEVMLIAADGASGAIGLEGAGVVTLNVQGNAGQEMQLGAMALRGIQHLTINSNSQADLLLNLSDTKDLSELTVTSAGSVHVVTGANAFPMMSPIAATMFDFTAAQGPVIFDASDARPDASVPDGTAIDVHGSLTAANTFHDSLELFNELLFGGSQNDQVFYGGGACDTELGSGGDTVDFGGLAGDNASGARIYVESAGDSGIDPGAADVFIAASAYNPDLCDTITGLRNDRPHNATEGVSFEFQGPDNANKAAPVGFGTAILFGTTTVTQNGYFLLDNSEFEANTAYLFQDVNGSATIDRGDIMIRLVGSEAFEAGEFRDGPLDGLEFISQ